MTTGGRVRRVVLDYEMKRDHPRFLHERNRGRGDCDCRPDRHPAEIVRWAQEHQLPAITQASFAVCSAP